MGRFKEKRQRCRSCGAQYISHEEKETDVNIGAHLMADGLKDRYDRALVISADTDLNPAVDLAQAETDGKIIQIVAPPRRKRNNRKALFAISEGRVKTSLLPAECRSRDGSRMISRPPQYNPPS